MASLADSFSDDDFGYDLSLEDEKLLASLADAPEPAVRTTGVLLETHQLHDAGNIPHSSPRRMAALVGVGRSISVSTFMRKTQPKSTPIVVPEDHVKYPDRTFCPSSSSQSRFCAGQS